MMRSPFPAAWFGAALLSTAVIAACGGDDVLGPPDGAACTVGSIAPGDSVHGAVGSTSCQTFDPNDYIVSNSVAWTLSIKKNQGYVVRMYHDSSAAAGDNLNAYLEAFGRGIHGEPTMVTASSDNFDANNGNGGNNYEMFLVGDRDRDISIRVQTLSPADTGLYSLVVASCQVTALNDTLVHTGIDLSGGCLTRTLDGPLVKVSFMTFPSDSTGATVTLHRTAGTGFFLSSVSGPMPDVACWNNDCSSSSNGFDTTATHTLGFNYPGLMAVMAGVHADSAVTISVAALFTRPATVAGRTH